MGLLHYSRYIILLQIWTTHGTTDLLLLLYFTELIFYKEDFIACVLKSTGQFFGTCQSKLIFKESRILWTGRSNLFVSWYASYYLNDWKNLVIWLITFVLAYYLRKRYRMLESKERYALKYKTVPLCDSKTTILLHYRHYLWVIMYRWWLLINIRFSLVCFEHKG